jgi:hypothetical protein
VVQKEMKRNYYFQEVKISLLKHLVRTRQESRCQVVQEEMKKIAFFIIFKK